MRIGLFAALLLLSSSLGAQTVTTIAGHTGEAGFRDGVGRNAQFNRPTWVDVDPGDGAIYVVDRENDRLRKIANGVVTTPQPDPNGNWPFPSIDFGGPFGGGIAVEPENAGCGSGFWAQGIYLSDSGGNRIHFVVDLAPVFLTYAMRDDASSVIGTGAPGATDAMQTQASFAHPGDIALSWNYTGYGAVNSPDAVFIADSGNHTIRRIGFRMSFEFCAQPYYVTTFAGAAGQAGTADGKDASARFNSPRGIASAPDGSVYVADTGNHTIRRIAADGTVTTVAGHAGVAGFADGVAADALLNMPSGIDVNALGEVFIADTGNYVIRKLTLDGRLITIAGTPGAAGFRDGAARNAQFSGVVGLRFYENALYLADTANNAIRKLDLTPGEPRRRAARH
jgi:NHL repeat